MIHFDGGSGGLNKFSVTDAARVANVLALCLKKEKVLPGPSDGKQDFNTRKNT
jgi:hypothetical protein